MCMWQSQALAGALSFGPSLPVEFGTVCWARAGLILNAAIVPAPARNVWRLIAPGPLIASTVPSLCVFRARLLPRALFVTMHRRIRLGVAHEQIDHERDADHASEIIIVPALMAERFEPERDRVRGATEDRDGER